MKNDYNEIDLAILEEQFPTIFVFKEWFTTEELEEMDRLEQEALKED